MERSFQYLFPQIYLACRPVVLQCCLWYLLGLTPGRPGERRPAGCSRSAAPPSHIQLCYNHTQLQDNLRPVQLLRGSAGRPTRLPDFISHVGSRRVMCLRRLLYDKLPVNPLFVAQAVLESVCVSGLLWALLPPALSDETLLNVTSALHLLMTWGKRPEHYLVCFHFDKNPPPTPILFIPSMSFGCISDPLTSNLSACVTPEQVSRLVELSGRMQSPQLSYHSAAIISKLEMTGNVEWMRDSLENALHCKTGLFKNKIQSLNLRIKVLKTSGNYLAMYLTRFLDIRCEMLNLKLRNL